MHSDNSHVVRSITVIDARSHETRMSPFTSKFVYSFQIQIQIQIQQTANTPLFNTPAQRIQQQKKDLVFHFGYSQTDDGYTFAQRCYNVECPDQSIGLGCTMLLSRPFLTGFAITLQSPFISCPSPAARSYAVCTVVGIVCPPPVPLVTLVKRFTRKFANSLGPL